MNKSVPDQEMQRFLRQQQLISGICRLFTGKGETEEMILPALQLAGEYLDLCRAALLDYREQTLQCQYVWPNQDTADGPQPGAAAALSEAQTQVIESLARRDIGYYILDGADIPSLFGLSGGLSLLLPLFCGADFGGLLALTRGAGHAGIPWAELDISLGQTLAVILAGAISRSRREENLQHSLTVAKELADQASQAKVDFLSRMNHEMRTPMNAIIGMTDIALESASVEKKDYCLNNIYEASRHLLNVINDIFDMSKMEASQLTLSIDEFDFEQSLLNLVEVVNALAMEKRQKLLADLDPAVPRYLLGDELRIGQVINNLLVNAIKFTPDGGTIRLNVKQLAVQGDLHTLQVDVSDNGIGISPAQQTRLFLPFEQADGGIARKYGGAGLGLAICQHIVNLMGGDIRVNSAINQGSTFTFTMKLQKSKFQPKQAGAFRRGDLLKTAEGDPYKPISYTNSPEDACAAEYGSFLPLIDVAGALERAMDNKKLYFTLLHNFSGRALVDNLITPIGNNDHKQTVQAAQIMRSVAVNLGLSGLLTAAEEIEGQAKMEISSQALLSKLEETLRHTTDSIERLLEGEGIR